MQINSLQASAASQAATRANSAKPTAKIESAPAINSASADQLELSPEAQALSQTQAGGIGDSTGIRADKVAAIRQAIADGTYETPEKLDVALDKMLDTFA